MNLIGDYDARMPASFSKPYSMKLHEVPGVKCKHRSLHFRSVSKVCFISNTDKSRFMSAYNIDITSSEGFD